MSKFRVLIIAVAILFTVLLLRLFHLQVRTFADYAKESEDNRINQKRVKAPRGRILDRLVGASLPAIGPPTRSR